MTCLNDVEQPSGYTCANRRTPTLAATYASHFSASVEMVEMMVSTPASAFSKHSGSSKLITTTCQPSEVKSVLGFALSAVTCNFRHEVGDKSSTYYIRQQRNLIACIDCYISCNAQIESASAGHVYSLVMVKWRKHAFSQSKGSP